MSKIKNLGKAVCVAFSIYSKIPMPKFDWASEDMKYHLCFFPWIGAVIGACSIGLDWLACRWGINELFRICILMALPLMITGGFHADGFMDTMDALHSYQDKNRKLEILKDPHIGAFSVIMLALYGVLYLGFLSGITSSFIVIYGGCFFLTRALSGILVVMMPGAKKDGMLSATKQTADGKIIGAVLGLQILVVVAALFLYDIRASVLIVLVLFGSVMHFMHLCKKEFGGITGDLSGYFVVSSQLYCTVCLSMLSVILERL